MVHTRCITESFDSFFLGWVGGGGVFLWMVPYIAKYSSRAFGWQCPQNIIVSLSNRPCPSCTKPLFQSEAKCKAIIPRQVKLIFSSCLVLKGRIFGIRKWPMSRPAMIFPWFCFSVPLLPQKHHFRLSWSSHWI